MGLRRKRDNPAGTIRILYRFLSSVMAFYVLLILLWVIISAFGLTGILIYRPMHFFFGNLKYLDFYLRYGIPTIYLYTGLFFLLAMIVCGVSAETTSSDEDSSADFAPCPKPSPKNKKGVAVKYREFKSTTYLWLMPVVFVLVVGFSWNNVMPDFKMVLAGEYLTVEVDSDRFWTDRTAIRRSFGYDYTISIPENLVLNNDTPQDTNMSEHYFFHLGGYALNASLPLYEEIGALHSSPFDQYIATPDGLVKKESNEREYITIQLHYLPNTRCLLGYNVV